MSEKINDGGPAFPMDSARNSYNPGMSLRDWFAGQALGDLARESIVRGVAARGSLSESCELCADTCYKYADAMLRAREVQP
jgi:hypothetical protein